jgi:hypothetical protein
MGQDMPDIDSLAIEVDGRNQSVSVPTYIEDDQSTIPAYSAGSWVSHRSAKPTP